MRADTRAVLQLPWSKVETLLAACQRADRTKLHDISREVGDVRLLLKGAHRAVVAPVHEHYRFVLRNLRGEAHAAPAENATLPVQGDGRSERDWLDVMSLGLDVARGSRAIGKG